jgi:predicted N-formylglutamate amidohydrolase
MVPVVSCEHAGNSIPDEYQHLFVGHEEVLASHRGWDPGAWEVAHHLASSLSVVPHKNLITRLLIEVNRSVGNTEVFSTFTDCLSSIEKKALMELIYLPYRSKIEREISEVQDSVVHLSIHSFVPEWKGAVRPVEIGLLFDPARREETSFCDELKYLLEKHLRKFRIVYNEPYKGVDDGLTTYLRTRFSDSKYRGIEIELNQGLVGTSAWPQVKTALTHSIDMLINQSS